jgi:CheY-like chemotaxis protein
MARAPIMLIDDDRAHLLITQRYLEKAGADRPIISYANSEGALAYLEHAKNGTDSARIPALILCDLKMPMLGGLEILSWLKERPDFAGLPVVMLSTSDEPSDMSAAKALGANRYLVKFPPLETFAEVLQLAIDNGKAAASAPIVVVEENPDDLYLLTHRIKGSGSTHPIVDFADPADAIAYFERALQSANKGDLPCILFTDLKLLGGDGFEIIEWIRARPALQEMKIFVISGSENPRHRERASALGVTGFLLKFPSAEEFKRLLDGSCI